MDVFGASHILVISIIAATGAVVHFRTYLRMAANGVFLLWLYTMLIGPLTLTIHLGANLGLPWFLIPSVAFTNSILARLVSSMLRGVGLRPPLEEESPWTRKIMLTVDRVTHHWLLHGGSLALVLMMLSDPLSHPMFTEWGDACVDANQKNITAGNFVYGHTDCHLSCMDIPSLPLRTGRSAVYLPTPDFRLSIFAAGMGVFFGTAGVENCFGACNLKPRWTGKSLLRGSFKHKTAETDKIANVIVLCLLALPTTLSFVIFGELLLRGSVVGYEFDAVGTSLSSFIPLRIPI